MIISFSEKSFADYNQWEVDNKKLFKRIGALIKEIVRTPFSGTGKPEPLKHDLSGCWSRRIDGTNRLVYQVIDNEVLIVSCKYHYHE